MKWLLVGLLALVASVGVALVALPDPGYVLIGYGNYSLEMTLLVFLVALAVIYLALRVLAGVWHAPGRIRRWSYRRQSRRLRRLFDGAVAELLEGRSERAERRLARLVYASESPLDVYLSAARAANRIGADDRRDYYLKLALQRHPGAELAIGLTEAELQLSRSQLDQAQTTLTRLRSLSPRNSRVLRLLLQLYLQQEDWQRLSELLPELRNREVLSGEQWQRLAVQVHREQFRELGAAQNLEAMKSGWKRLAPALQKDEGMFSVYIRELLRLGDGEHAERLLREQLKQVWDPRFVYSYGELAAADAAAQLKVAEGWLERHPDDPVLLLTLGKISLRNELWGKARGYLESGIARQPTPEAYRLLGALLERLEEPDQAAECYRKGIELVTQAEPGAVLPEPDQTDTVLLLTRSA